jgi:drug/metabolite transporter (DMT)-like permease
MNRDKDTDSKSERLSLLYAISAVMLWSTVATAFKISLRYVAVYHLVAGATFFSALSLSIILVARGELKLAFRMLPRTLPTALGLAAINPIVYYPVLLTAYSRLPAQVAQPLNYTWAIALSLMSVPLLGQRLSRRDGWALVLGYAGVVVVSQGGTQLNGQVDPIGIALALGSSVLWALYWILKTKDSRPKLIALFQDFVVAVPVVGLLGLLVDGPPQPGSFSLPALGATAYLGLFEMGFTFALWQQALSHSPNVARTAQLIFVGPFLSMFFISSIAKEPIMPLSVVGLVLIVGGLWLGQRARAKRG